MHLWPHTVYHVSVLVQQSISTMQNMGGLATSMQEFQVLDTRDNMKDGFWTLVIILLLVMRSRCYQWADIS